MGTYFGGGEFGVPGLGVFKAQALADKAATSSCVAHRQVMRAAVLLVIAAHRIGQRAAGPRQAVAKKFALAAAGRICGSMARLSSVMHMHT